MPQLLENIGGPARIRTLDQRIMSSPVLSEAEEDKSVTPAKQGKVRQKLQPGRNLDSEEVTRDLTRVMSRLRAIYRSWVIPCAGKQV